MFFRRDEENFPSYGESYEIHTSDNLSAAVKKVLQDRERKHYEKEILISKLFEEDQEACLVLTSKEYQCVR